MNNITEQEKLFVLLSMCEIPNKKQEKLLNSLEDFTIDALFKDNCADILSTEEIKRLASAYDRQTFESSIQNMIDSGIVILTVLSDDYPKRLIDLPDRPMILYTKGDLSLFDKTSIAMVGTRMPTNYGRMMTEKFADELASSGFVIISGLCYGVDEIAHRKTLEVGGKTIAVIGSGFQNIYPSTNTPLSQDIAEKGLLVSEYYPSFRPKKYTFPQRNRIVAGLSDGVLITEAGAKSGTVHTKEFALEYGKDVFAVPGNINSPKSELPNMMIKSAQAECVLSPNDIVEFYGLEKKAKEQKTFTLNIEEQTIINLLKDGEQDYEFLVIKSKIPVNILNSYLTTLEIRGLIRRLPGKIYALA